MRTRTIVALLSLVVAAGCNGANDEDTLTPTTNTLNTACAVAGNFPQGMASVGEYLIFIVNETEQGQTDLNDDGDVADDVVHVLDTVSGTVTNLEISAIHNFASDGTTVGWLVAEEDEDEDLNGDGDESDHFLAIFDPAAAVSATNPRVVGTAGITPGTGINQSVPIQAENGNYVYAEHESLMEANSTVPGAGDLNGDIADDMGFFLDSYLTVYSVGGDTLRRTGTASNSTELAFLLRNGVLAFTVSESEGPAGMDLNTDTDSDDVILMYHVTGSGTDVSTNRCVDPFGFTIAGTPTAPVLAYAIDESGDSRNFNEFGLLHDFDTDDFVVATWSIGPNVESFPGGGIAIQPQRLSGSRTRLSFAASEEENGLVPGDFNSDGDSEDIVPFWVDLADPTQANAVGLSMPSEETSGYPVVCDDFMLVFADEASQGSGGTNYNSAFGDTDIDDTVAFFVDISQSGTTTLTNLGIAGSQLICSSTVDPEWFFVTASESDNAGEDLNLDGDSVDEVFAYFPVNTSGQVDGTIRVGRYGGTSTSVFVDCPSSVAIVNFAQEGTGVFTQDINKDLDALDVVATVQLVNKANGSFGDEVFIGTVLTTEQAEEVEGDEEVEESVGISIFPYIINGDTFAFPALESALGEGVDYNGDGDRDDSVLFCFTLDCN